MAQLLQSERLDGPDGTRVQVLFYEDASIRFRIYKKPLVIEEAFLTGNQQGHSIIKLAPAGSNEEPTTTEGPTDLGAAKELLEEFLSRFSWLDSHPDYFDDVRRFLGKD